MADEINVFDFTDYPNKMTGNFGYLNLSDPTIWTGPYSMMQIVHALYTEYTKDFELLVTNLNTTINAEWEKLKNWQGDMETAWATYQENLNKAWAEYQEGLNQAWEKYQEGLNQAWATYQEKLNGEWAEYKTELNQEWKNMQNSWEEYKTSLNQAWANYQSTMEQKWTAYQNTMEQKWTAYQTALNKEWADYQTTLSGEWNSYKMELSGSWSAYKTDFEKTWSTYKTDFEKTWSDYKTSVTDDLNTWKSLFEYEFGNMKTQWNEFQNSLGTQWEEYQTNVNQDIASFKGTVEQQLTVYQKRPTSTTSNGFVRADIGSMGGLDKFADNYGMLGVRSITPTVQTCTFNGSTLSKVENEKAEFNPMLFYHYVDENKKEYGLCVMIGPNPIGTDFVQISAIGAGDADVIYTSAYDGYTYIASAWGTDALNPKDTTSFWVPVTGGGAKLVTVDLNTSSRSVIFTLDSNSKITNVESNTSVNFLNYAKSIIAPAWCLDYGGDLCYWGTKEIDGVSYHRFAFMGGVKYDTSTNAWTVPTSTSESRAEFYLTDAQSEIMFGNYLNNSTSFARGTINGQFYCVSDDSSTSFPVKIWGITADKNFTDEAPGAVGCYHSFTFNETLVADAINHFFISNIETTDGGIFDIRPKECALSLLGLPSISSAFVKYAPKNSILYMFQPQCYKDLDGNVDPWRVIQGHTSNTWFDAFTGRLAHLLPNHPLFDTALTYFAGTRKFNEIHLNKPFFSLTYTVPGSVGYYPEPAYNLIIEPITTESGKSYGPYLKMDGNMIGNDYWYYTNYPIMVCTLNAIIYDGHYLWPFGLDTDYNDWETNASKMVWSLPVFSLNDVGKTLSAINASGPSWYFLTPMLNVGVRLNTSLGSKNQYMDIKKCGLGFGGFADINHYQFSDGLTAMPYAMEPYTIVD